MHRQTISGALLFSGKTLLPVDPTMKIVLVGGCFDIIHYGHFTYLKNAKAQGDVLVVALENDAFIREHKDRAPFHTQRQRAQMLLNLKTVDCVILLPTMRSDEKYRALVDSVRPYAIAVTAGDPLIHKKREYAKIVGARLKTVNKIVSGLSSSTITTYARILQD